MIKRQTWITFAVFIVVLVAAIIWTRAKSRKSEPTPTPTAITNFFNFDEATIASLKIADDKGKLVSIARSQDGLWALEEPKAEYTDVAAVESAMTQLVALHIMTTLSATSDLAEYGLDHPAYTITVTLDGGQQTVAQIGSLTPTKSGYYARIDGSTPQIVTQYSLDAVLKLLQNPPIATPTAAPTMTSTPTMEVIVSTLEATSTPTVTPTP
jgi:hypothetical protein